VRRRDNAAFRKPELVVGAGDMEKLAVAARFGADAVYCGSSDFSLRARCKNFSREELAFAAGYLHERGKKLYVTVNSIVHEKKLGDLSDYLVFLDGIGADAIIFMDMAVLSLARKLGIKARLHLSTQASSANSLALAFFSEMGVARVNLARECSLDEIESFPEIPGLTLEAFIHGAMCVSYSGRCLLSNYLAGRGANDGECAQACRWKYSLVEEKRPGEYFPLVEGLEGQGTYIFNSRDLMALQHLPRLFAAGVDAFKVEGRIKGSHYVAMVTKAYRMAFDRFEKSVAAGEEFVPSDEVVRMLGSVSNRGYIDGFYTGAVKGDGHNYDSAKYIKTFRMVGIVTERISAGEYRVAVRNNIVAGRSYEFVCPTGIFEVGIAMMRSAEGDIRSKAVNQKEVLITLEGAEPAEFGEYDIIRERNSD